MKNLPLILLLLGSCCTAAVAQPAADITEAGRVAMGLKAEANLSDFRLDKSSNVRSKMGTGATVGGFVGLPIARHFAVQGDLLYHYKSSDVEALGVSYPYRYVGMEIAIYALARQTVGRGRQIYVGLGPYSEFGFMAQYVKNGATVDLYEKDAATQLSPMLDFSSGFGLVVGYEFPCGVQLNLACKVAFTNVLDANSATFAMYPRAVSAGVGYRFGKKR